MSKMRDTDAIIDELVRAADPVRPRSARAGRLALLGIAAASVAAVLITYGVRSDIMAGTPSPMLFLAAGLMLILAVAAGAGASRMASPQVGATGTGVEGAFVAVMLLPAIALVGIAAGTGQMADLAVGSGLRCLALGLAASLGSIAFLVHWLRRGAPVRPERAAWVAGLAAGSIGALAVTLECTRDAFAHMGVWHVAIILSVATLSRLVLPRFLRW